MSSYNVIILFVHYCWTWTLIQQQVQRNVRTRTPASSWFYFWYCNTYFGVAICILTAYFIYSGKGYIFTRDTGVWAGVNIQLLNMLTKLCSEKKKQFMWSSHKNTSEWRREFFHLKRFCCLFSGHCAFVPVCDLEERFVCCISNANRQKIWPEWSQHKVQLSSWENN